MPDVTGTVIEIERRDAPNGQPVVRMVIESAGYQGRADYLEVEFYGKGCASVNAVEGETVTVSYDTRSRKSKLGKWFTRAHAWRCATAAAADAVAPAMPPDDDMPF